MDNLQLHNPTFVLYIMQLEILSHGAEACKYKTEDIVREPGCGLREDSEYNARCSAEDKQLFVNTYQVRDPAPVSVSATGNVQTERVCSDIIHSYFKTIFVRIAILYLR